MTTKKIIKVFSFFLIFAIGFIAMQSCKDKKNDKQATEVKAESTDMKCEPGKCGEGKCGDAKAVKDSTETEEGKCGDDKAEKDSTKVKTESTDMKCEPGKCG